MVTGRFSHRIYIAYSTLYCVGTILSMQISFVGFQPVQSSEHMLVSNFNYWHWSNSIIWKNETTMCLQHTKMALMLALP